MKRKAAVIYFIICMILFFASLFTNADYFYRLAYDNLIWYQLKQAAGVLVLFAVGYLFLKAIQDYFNDVWVVLLAMPCGAALWVFAGQALFLTNITYMMHRVFIVLAIILLIGFGIRKNKKLPLQGRLFPSVEICLCVIGTALLVSTGWNYINMNYDSYMYFTDYGRIMAVAGDYREWNSKDAFIITNIGQFLPTLNSYAVFWGVEYAVSILSFMVLNMTAIFAVAVYELTAGMESVSKRHFFTVLLTAAMISCTCVVVFANWMLSNAFIMYYLTIMGILGVRAPSKFKIDYALVLSGSALSITLLRKDGIIIVCFLFVCYCCNKIMNSRRLLLLFLPSAFVQIYYICYVRFFLRSNTTTARGTSILSDKFVFMLLAAVFLTILYMMFLHGLFEKWLGRNIFVVYLGILAVAVIGAVSIKFMPSVNHVDAILKVLASPAYGFSVITWLLLLAVVFTDKVSVDYELFLIAGYCILTFLIYWNKGNTEQGIDNSGMRMFVQLVPMIYFVGADKLCGILTRKKK